MCKWEADLATSVEGRKLIELPLNRFGISTNKNYLLCYPLFIFYSIVKTVQSDNLQSVLQALQSFPLKHKILSLHPVMISC